ncbi:hypothetical protein P8452_14585 [Trifolium repens]|nr:hypothetical protein P8452_14585 [Trifolium repens]
MTTIEVTEDEALGMKDIRAEKDTLHMTLAATTRVRELYHNVKVKENSFTTEKERTITIPPEDLLLGELQNVES